MTLKQVINIGWTIIIITVLIFVCGFDEQAIDEYFKRKEEQKKMIKIYKLDELKEVNIKAYLKVTYKLMHEIGGVTEEAIERYCNQALIFADEKANIYKMR